MDTILEADKHLVKAESDSDIQNIANLAVLIWNEHYVPIIGQNQVDYMVERFQSFEAMKSQIVEGFEYYGLIQKNKLIGYCSILAKGKSLFISKIYVDKTYRGQQNGSFMMNKLKDLALSRGLKQFRLTVNKNNTSSIRFYENQGFKINRPLTIDIGQGYVMDDYELVKDLTA